MSNTKHTLVFCLSVVTKKVIFNTGNINLQCIKVSNREFIDADNFRCNNYLTQKFLDTLCFHIIIERKKI